MVLLPPFFYFWIKVPHEALAQSFIDFPRTNLAGRHIPLPGPGSILAWSVLYLPLAIMLAAISVFVRRSRRGGPRSFCCWS